MSRDPRSRQAAALPVKRRFPYSVRALLASGALYYVLELSQSDRGMVDYGVITLVILVIAWNVGQLGRRMHAAGGGKGLWAVGRVVLFWVIGLRNTAWLRPEAVGTWENWLGWVVLGLAAFDTIALFRAERAELSKVEAPSEPQSDASSG